MLKAENISFGYYNQKNILKDINLNIHQGEIVGLYGPSGRGKTTLAKILSGYNKPLKGKILLDNTTIPKKGTRPVQLVWQQPEKTLNPNWTMKKVLQEISNPDKELLNALGIQKEWLNRRPYELSAGELQRFCLARALNPSTRFLIADEITTMLDAVTQAQIWHFLIDIVRNRKLGILAISHDEILLRRTCNRIIELKDIENG
jgi:peptide/nickel transport system ATP-binding protein